MVHDDSYSPSPLRHRVESVDKCSGGSRGVGLRVSSALLEYTMNFRLNFRGAGGMGFRKCLC